MYKRTLILLRKCWPAVTVLLILATIMLTKTSDNKSNKNEYITQDKCHEYMYENYNNNLKVQEKIDGNLNIIYYHQPLHVCRKNNSSYHLLILVKSDASNIAQRMTIRKTWGNISTPGIKVLFSLGASNVVESFIDFESSNYQDIIQGDFTDSYLNNTYKTVMTFNWVTENCLKTQYLFFTDDDFFLNVKNIITTIKDLSLEPYIYRGALIRNNVPVRNPNSKWFVPFSEYLYDLFPPYLAGGSFLISMNVAQKFKEAFSYVKYLRIDDVYLGIVAKYCRIEPSNDRRISLSYNHLKSTDLSTAISSHGFENHRHLNDVWKAFIQRNIPV